MRALALALCLGALASPARAWQFLTWRTPQYEAAEKLFLAERFPELIASLTPEALAKLRFSGKQPAAYYFLGVSHERLRQFDRALGVYQLGTRLYPRDTDLLTRLGQLLHSSLLEERAIPIFERVLRLDPNNTAALIGLAEIDRNLGLLDQSAAYYDRALELLPRDADLWRDYAELNLARRDYETADIAIRLSLQRRPSADSRLVLARIRRADGDPQEALDILLELCANPPPGRALELSLLAAVWHMEARQWHGAVARAQQVLRAAPDNPLARYVMARAHLQAGRRAQAVKELRVAAAGSEPFVAKVAAGVLKSLAPPRGGE
ncbi:MAG: tetratricopeptide repeat protein [Elusimicrobia bacterium]|nr:tetratricopeptide repeat protein [Elusimicrobiota bacterium]